MRNTQALKHYSVFQHCSHLPVIQVVCVWCSISGLPSCRIILQWVGLAYFGRTFFHGGWCIPTMTSAWIPVNSGICNALRYGCWRMNLYADMAIIRYINPPVARIIHPLLCFNFILIVFLTNIAHIQPTSHTTKWSTHLGFTAYQFCCYLVAV